MSENGKQEEESRHALLERLIKILGMTTANNDNLALVATRKANEVLAQLETDWATLLRGKVTILADPFVNVPAPPPQKRPPPMNEPPRQRPSATRPQPAPQAARSSPGSYRCPQCNVQCGVTSFMGDPGQWFCSQRCKDAMHPTTSRWKPAPPPRFKDKAAIQACIDKISANPIKHSGTQYRINSIAAEFQRVGDLSQGDWSFLAGTAAALRGAKVTADML